jgi:cysteine desulfurase / selenocysteine lyase
MENLVYLDNAATTFPKPDAMHDFMADFYRRCGVNPGRTGCDLAMEAEAVIHGCREKLSALFNGSLVDSGRAPDPDRVVFAMNATGALNLMIRGVLGPGRHVVTTCLEHNSVLRPVNHMVELGAAASFVSCDDEGFIDPADVRRAIRPETALVIVNHGSNVLGTVQDLAAIGEVCREAGVPLGVDAAQTAGVVPIDMAACGISFLAFTGHKGLFGPTGTGGLCVAPDARIERSLWGGTGVRSAERLHLEEFPWRLEAGTLNLLGIAGLSKGVDWVLAHGVEALRAQELDLLGLLQEGLAGIPGVTQHGTRRLDRRTAVLSVSVDGFDAGDVGTFLDVDHDILTRTGLHCAPLAHERMGTAPAGTVRFSLGPWNTREDVARAVAAMREIAGRGRDAKPAVRAVRARSALRKPWGCPLTKNRTPRCFGLCVPAGTKGLCGREAAHALTGRTGDAIRAYGPLRGGGGE